MPQGQSKSVLLQLPTEIRLLIWKYTYGNAIIPLYNDDYTGDPYSWDDMPYCYQCLETSARFLSGGRDSTQASNKLADQVRRVSRRYTQGIESLLVCKNVYSEAIEIFRSSLTFHIRSSEGLGLIRHFAPSQLRTSISKIVLFVHFTKQNEIAWYVRLIDLTNMLPNLKHVAINYHMMPPSSYEALATSIYLSMPLLALKPPFNKPLYVVTEKVRSANCMDRYNDRDLPSTDPQPGLTIHTGYTENQTLFASDFLGDITVADAWDEHTAVVQNLFTSEAYISAARTFLASDVHHRDWSKYQPFRIPRAEVPGEIINIRGGRTLYESLLAIAHELEKPWFEKLQRRKVLELYMEHGDMSREEAENYLDRALASLGEGAISILLEALMEGDELSLLPNP